VDFLCFNLDFIACAVVWLFCPLGKTRHLEGATLDTERTSWWWHLWRVETCRRLTNVWCV